MNLSLWKPSDNITDLQRILIEKNEDIRRAIDDSRIIQRSGGGDCFKFLTNIKETLVS